MADVKLEILTLEALRSAIKASGEHRLISDGKESGLLRAGKSKKTATSLAESQCLDPSLGLFAISTKEVEIDGQRSSVLFAKITNRGIEALVANIELEEINDVKRESAESHRYTLWAAIQRSIPNRLSAMRSRREAFATEEESIVETLRGLLRDRRAELQGERQRIENAEVLIAQIHGAPVVKSVAEDVFLKQVCESLVFAWEDDVPARRSLERVMRNNGLSPVEKIGDEVAFDGRYHRAMAALLPGQPAKVVTVGWSYVTLSGNTVLVLKPQVTTL